MSRAEAETLTKKVLSYVAVDAARVSVGSGTLSNSRFAVNQISTAGDNYTTNVTVRATVGKRSATASGNRLDDDSLKALVKKAEALARLSPEDPEAMPELGAQTYRESPGWSDQTASLDPAGRATAVQKITSQAEKAGLVSTGYLEITAGANAVASSNGMFAWGRTTAAALTTTVRTPDGTGSGWAGASTNDWARIDPAALGERAVQKAKASTNAVAVEPGRYTVVLEPTAVGNLVQLIGGSLQARAADEGRSFFSKPGGGTKIGLKVVDERVTLTSDPYDPDTYGNAFTGEGLPTERITWIENGVVKNLAYDRYWAQQKSMKPTGAQGSFKMSGGNSSLEEMIASTERGLLVTRLWYIRGVDPRVILFTGLTRDGTFLIEKGKITRAVKNLRWNESPIFMLNNIEMMGKPERVSASESGSAGQALVVPPIKARDFTFTSLSDAV
ncbi:MAG: TldD/PmbA family protein [Phycisphaerae bacterium]|nr:TldD/PmbA family protein [Gemmatimonadaceae bacterium]